MKNGQAITKVPKDLIEYNRRNLTNYNQLNELISSKTDYKDVEHVPNSAQGYSPTPYIVSSVIIFICRLFRINIWITIYLIRLFNLAVFAVAGYFSLKYIPIGKLALFVYMFNPIVIQQAASASCDSLIFACIITYISYTVYLMLSKEKMTKKDAVIYGILAVSVAMSKNIYMPIIFINLGLIFKKSFNIKTKLYIIGISILCVGLTLGWYVIGNNYTPVFAEAGKDDVNASEQLHYVLGNLNQVPTILRNSFRQYGMQWTLELFGGRLGYLHICSPMWSIITYAVALLLSVFLEKNDKQFYWQQRIVNILIFLGIAALTYLGLYMTWNPVGNILILGIQGRYFIPLLPLVLLSIKCKKINYNLKYSGIIFACIMTVINVASLHAIVNFFV